jgi:hypothetical protein
MKLSTLRKSAQGTTKARGHRMRWGNPYGNATALVFSQNGQCSKCGMEVTLHERPAPNQIDIGGEAVALTCKGR